MNIYVASSWRNPRHKDIIELIRDCNLSVYDFQHDGEAFDWSDIDPSWKSEDDIEATSGQIIKNLNHPLAVAAFEADMDALLSADMVLLCLPCGKSAHLEAGIAIASRIPVWILLTENARPELTYRSAQLILNSEDDLRFRLERLGRL